MPNSYLTSTDMDLIERLLAVSRELPLDDEREKTRARFLVECFEEGMTEEDGLKRALQDRLTIADASLLPEPGMLSKLYRLLSAHRDGKAVVEPDDGVDEAQRRIDNDTDGTRRRANELKNRHHLH